MLVKVWPMRVKTWPMLVKAWSTFLCYSIGLCQSVTHACQTASHACQVADHACQNGDKLSINSEKTLKTQKTMDNVLKKYWTTLSKPGSFAGIDKLYRALKADGHKISKQQVETWLSERLTYQLHKPVKKRFIRKSVIVSGPNIMWDVDLLDLKEHVKYNFRNRYILTVV